MELYKKVIIKSEDDLPKEGEYLAHSKSKKYHLWAFDCSENDTITWMTYVDWYLLPIKQKQKEVSTITIESLKKEISEHIGRIKELEQRQVTDEEIEVWLTTGVNWSRTFINGAMYGAKAMRGGLIKTK